DWTQEDWQPLFGDRFGLSYAELALYRAVATPVATISEKTLMGRPQHLWKLPKFDNSCQSIG
ncbi:MAG: hypothetical protein Q7O66_18270, partial [Dehalococcoidia bacterium]|nr:hypothetical protein [Dehalococcoidia bacterium]